MVGLSGLEKFSHLEDKIYRTIELTKTLRQEKENLEKELAVIHRDMGNVLNEKERLESQVEKLLAEKRKFLGGTKGKLSNASFVDRAPAEVVQQQRDLVTDLENQIRTMEDILAELRK